MHPDSAPPTHFNKLSISFSCIVEPRHLRYVQWGLQEELDMGMVVQVAKATLSDANVMLDSTIGADQFGASSAGTFEEPVRERFKAAAAVSPRFLLLDFRYCLACTTAKQTHAGIALGMQGLGMQALVLGVAKLSFALPKPLASCKAGIISTAKEHAAHLWITMYKGLGGTSRHRDCEVPARTSHSSCMGPLITNLGPVAIAN